MKLSRQYAVGESRGYQRPVTLESDATEVDKRQPVGGHWHFGGGRACTR